MLDAVATAERILCNEPITTVSRNFQPIGPREVSYSAHSEVIFISFSETMSYQMEVVIKR